MEPLRWFILVLVYLCFHTFETKAQWTQVNTGLTVTDVYSLTVSGTNLFAGTYNVGAIGGVFRSTDNGASWTGLGLARNDVRSLAVIGTSLFAGVIGGVFLSTDNGASWTQIFEGLEDKAVRCLVVSGCFLYARTYRAGVWQLPL